MIWFKCFNSDIEMRIFKTKTFAKWAVKQGINSANLCQAMLEIDSGLVDANLGGYLIKKRVAINGKGKSSGALIEVEQHG